VLGDGVFQRERGRIALGEAEDGGCGEALGEGGDFEQRGGCAAGAGVVAPDAEGGDDLAVACGEDRAAEVVIGEGAGDGGEGSAAVGFDEVLGFGGSGGGRLRGGDQAGPGAEHDRQPS
jgi:hypothetical protein